MNWRDALDVFVAFVLGNFSGGWIFKEFLSDKLQGRRARQERQAELQLNLLLSLQGAMEQVNQGRVVWGATKVATEEVMKKWPTQLPPPDRELLAEQGDAAIRSILPSIRDDEVRTLVAEFQKLALGAFHGTSKAETWPKVEAARKAQEAANERIGKMIQSL